MIVAVAHMKGGTGKTTIAVQMSLYRKLKNPSKKVWLVDADSQQSASDCLSFRDEAAISPSVEHSFFSNGKDLAEGLREKADDFDDVIIDCGGRDSECLRIALLACDVLLIPTTPRAFEVWATSRFEEIIEEAKASGAEFQSYAFINRADRSAESRDVQEILSDMKEIKFLDAPVFNRLAFARAAAEGLSVLEQKKKDKKAIQEMQKLTNSVFKK